MANLQGKHKISSINSPSEFRKIIKKECARADRYKTKLSLIIYEIGNKSERDMTVRNLIRILGQRARNMDDIGWFDLAQIGVLLPHTPGEGASSLSSDIARLLDSSPETLPFTIYSYPSQLWPVKPRMSILLNLRLALQNTFRPHDITSSDDFRVTLNLEIDRANRYGYIFSLLVFDFTSAPSSEAPVAKIVTHLNGRLRETDEIGWFGHGKVAAILPYANTKDCQKIARLVCENAQVKKEGIYTIFTYPSNWLSDKRFSHPVHSSTPEGKKGAGGSQTPQKNRRQYKRANGYTSDSLFRRADTRSSSQQQVAGETAGLSIPTTDVDQFFAKKIPLGKRFVDVVLASLSLVICSPIFLLVALGIRLTSPGPILFKQVRVGYMQQNFTLYKFRTMHADAKSESHRKLMKRLISKEMDKGNTKLTNDERIFPFGHFLRKSCIDELPQLINVLKGEMSLVGPRPCLPYEAKEYLRWHTKRFFTVPGITGLWQISGKNKLSFKQMIRLDIRYEKNLSCWLDLKILLKTIPAVISIFFDRSK